MQEEGKVEVPEKVEVPVESPEVPAEEVPVEAPAKEQ